MKHPPRFTNLPLLALLLLALFGLSTSVHPTASAWGLPQLSGREGGEPETAGFVPGELLVKVRGGDSQLPSSLDLGYPVGPDGRIADLGVLRLKVPIGRELEAVRQLSATPQVEWAEPNYLGGAQWIPNDELYRQFQWGLRTIQAEEAWDVTTGRPEVVVALLDTGVDLTHPDLVGKLTEGYDFLNGDPDPEDDSGHGTLNAGVIGATSDNEIGVAGVAWGARIMPIKVLDANGEGPDSAIAQGLIFAADRGARVINMSFRTPMPSHVVAEAIRYAHRKGALLVAAAGNSADRGNDIVYPAAYEEVLAVSTTDQNEEVPEFSQHHPYVGVSAPGVEILSTFWRGAGYGAYAAASGTSVAAPHVSGLAALILSVNPRLTNREVERIIEETVEDLGVPGKDEYYGAGRINAYRAVLAAKPAPVAPRATPTPVPPAPAAPNSLMAAKTVWYFAEGSTAPPFDLWLLLQNSNETAIDARITYMRQDGSQQTQWVALPPASGKSILVNQVISEGDVSMKVESDSPLFAQRAMYFRSDGHTSLGAAAPSTRWFLAEGSTQGNFESWILLQNPQPVRVKVTLTFLTSKGEPREMVVTVPPTSRRSLYLNQLVPDAEVSTVISAELPIVAERSMYFGQTGGHGGTGANQLSQEWFLAEGRVGQGMDSWLLATNPNPMAAQIKVTHLQENGSPVTGHYTVPPWGRFSLYMNEVLPAGRWGTVVESSQPIEVERSTYFAGGRGGLSVVGSPLLSTEWFLPQGPTQPPVTQEIALLNPGDREAQLWVTFIQDGGDVETRYFTMPPTSRLTLRANDLPSNPKTSTEIVSDQPIAVERSTYFANGLGGTSSPGIPR